MNNMTLNVVMVGVVLVLQACIHSPSKSEKVIVYEPSPDAINLSTGWEWTADARGGGSQSSLHTNGDTLTVDSCYHVHFTRLDTALGSGTYRFMIKSRSFDFSWRITPGNPNQGKGLQLIYNMNVWPGQLKLVKSNWWGFYYGWPNQSEEISESIPFTFDHKKWHEVRIEDTGSEISVYFDGEKLPFLQNNTAQSYLSGLGPGYVGFGTTVSKTMIRDFWFEP